MAHVLPLGGSSLRAWRERQRLKRKKLEAWAALALRPDLDPTGAVARMVCERLLQTARAR